MNPSLAAKSLILFGVSILFLVLLTAFESTFIGISAVAERAITAGLLIVPGIVGVVCGALSLRRREMKAGMAIAGISLNLLFVLFHVFVLMFAG